jgi:hypothetical protein
MTSNRYIYHYAATYYPVSGAEIKIDGIALLIAPVKTYDDYQVAKSLILDDAQGRLPPCPRVNYLHVSNLSFLGMEQD